jgi:hypothetical protein
LRPSSQKGGTIIAEDVTDRATHDRRVCAPDGYRPPFCPNCGETRLHVHDYRERILLAEPEQAPVARIVRHRCVGCQAIWQTLPAFIARHLWRSWRVVERTLLGNPAPPASAPATHPRRWPPVAERTRRRWRARWLRQAQFLVQVLTTCGEAFWSALAGKLSTEASCADLVAACAAAQPTTAGHRLAAVAALVYRLQPLVRLV